MSGRGRFLHRVILAAGLVLLEAPSPDAADLAIVAHVHTPVSGGKYTPMELAGMLVDQGLDGAILTDHDHLEIEWGLPFFRHFLRSRYRRTSIATEGLDAYAGAIREAGEQYPDRLLLAGIEANPYYRIEIDPWPLRIRVLGLHEHILAFGLPASDLLDVPSVANGFHPRLDRWVVAYSGAALVFALAVLVWRLRRRPVHLRTLRLRRRRAWPLALATALAGLAVVDHVALRASVFHPYASEDPGTAPFQSFIDWVRARGGLTFWAHPGLDETIRRGPVEVVTRPYLRHLAAADRYDGLTGFHPGMIGPGGFWDRLLDDHCAGRREEPPWFLAQADFRDGRPRDLWSAVNHVEAAGRSEEALLEALRAGRFHASRSGLGRRWELRGLRATGGGTAVPTGGRLETRAAVTLEVTFAPRDDDPPPLHVRVVGNGLTVLERWINRQETLRFEEPAPAAGCRWYRILAGRSATRIHFVTNPIFVDGGTRGVR